LASESSLRIVWYDVNLLSFSIPLSEPNFPSGISKSEAEVSENLKRRLFVEIVYRKIERRAHVNKVKNSTEAGLGLNCNRNVTPTWSWLGVFIIDHLVKSIEA